MLPEGYGEWEDQSEKKLTVRAGAALHWRFFVFGWEIALNCYFENLMTELPYDFSVN